MNHSALVLQEDSSLCSSSLCSSLGRFLHRVCHLHPVQEQPFEAAGAAPGVNPDILVLRLHAPQAAQRIEPVRQRWPNARVLAILCRPGEPDRAMLDSVDDFIACPCSEWELTLRIERLLCAKRGGAGLANRCLDQLPLVGQSPSFQRVIEKIPLIADCKHTVMISGETGSGKEVVARAIHYQGSRRGKPFVAVNCGALPDHLFESELFGHIKGAFTDASSTEKGLIGEAEGGTLFLDEIDALSLAGQIKLLRFLQDGEYRPVGSSRSLHGDVRVIAATNTDLRKRVETEQFRKDLYYRLDALALIIPPLRERIEDLKPLSEFFLARYAQQHGQQARRVSPEAWQKLMSFSWPGNIRELESVITRSLTFSRALILGADDIALPVSTTAQAAVNSLRVAKLSTVQAFEREFLVNLLAKHRGNVTHAAKAAGKERRTFQRLLRKHNLSRDAF